MKSLHPNLSRGVTLQPLIRPTGTYNGTGVDLANYVDVQVIVITGAITNGTHAYSLEHSTDNTNWDAVGASDRVGSLANGTDSTTQAVGYIGSRRYLRVVQTVTSGATGANTCALIVGRVRRS